MAICYRVEQLKVAKIHQAELSSHSRPTQSWQGAERLRQWEKCVAYNVLNVQTIVQDTHTHTHTHSHVYRVKGRDFGSCLTMVILRITNTCMRSLTERYSVTNLFFIQLLILTDLNARLNMLGPPRYNMECCCTGQRPSLDSYLCIHSQHG